MEEISPGMNTCGNKGESKVGQQKMWNYKADLATKPWPILQISSLGRVLPIKSQSGWAFVPVPDSDEAAPGRGCSWMDWLSAPKADPQGDYRWLHFLQVHGRRKAAHLPVYICLHFHVILFTYLISLQMVQYWHYGFLYHCIIYFSPRCESLYVLQHECYIKIKNRGLVHILCLYFSYQLFNPGFLILLNFSLPVCKLLND